MTLYLRLADGLFGLTPDAVRQELSAEVAFVDGADLTEWGFAPYAEAPPPSLAANQQALEVAPSAGIQQWTVIDVAPTVPAEVWTYQGKTVMILTTLGSLGLDGAAVGLTAGDSILDAVNAAIDALPEPNRSVARENLNAPGMRRDAPLVAAMAATIGLTAEMIDNLFITAKSIP